MLTHIRCAILIQATEFLNLIPKHRQYSIALHAIPNGGKNVISIWLFFYDTKVSFDISTAKSLIFIGIKQVKMDKRNT